MSAVLRAVAELLAVLVVHTMCLERECCTSWNGIREQCGYLDPLETPGRQTMRHKSENLFAHPEDGDSGNHFRKGRGLQLTGNMSGPSQTTGPLTSQGQEAFL